MSELVHDDVDRCVTEVAVHLDDLPAGTRAELLEDLRAHLHEVIAEGGTLDAPADYAVELLRGRGPAAVARPSWWRRIGRQWWIAVAIVVGLVLVVGMSAGSHTQPVPPHRPGPSVPTLPISSGG